MPSPDAPKVVLIFGPIAVGKMSVGQALAQRTDLKLLHAHMTIDLVTQFFPFGTDAFRRVNRAFVLTLLHELLSDGTGAILTFIWNFDAAGSQDDIVGLASAIADYGGELVFAELQAPLEIRLQRNRSPSRRAAKNVSWATDEYLRDWDKRYRTASAGDFPYPERHLVVDTTILSAEQAADQIKSHFGLR